MQKKNYRNVFSVFIIGVFIIGIILTIYNTSTGKFNNTKKVITDSIANKKLPPVFEIGYLLIDLPVLQDIINKKDAGVSAEFMYPVLNTDVTKRVVTNFPLIVPDYGKMLFYDDLKTFIKLYRKRSEMLQNTWVACLLIKQKGMGKSINTVLEYNKAVLQTTEMYDGTDLNHIIYRQPDSMQSEGSGFIKNYTTGEFPLDTMSTNNSILIPLCILNFFVPANPSENTDENAWKQVTNGIILVPRKLRFQTMYGDTINLNMEEFLEKPILVSK